MLQYVSISLKATKRRARQEPNPAIDSGAVKIKRGSNQDIYIYIHISKVNKVWISTSRCCRTWNSGCGRYLLCNACQLASRVLHCIAKGGTSPISQRQTLHHLNIGQKHSNILTTFPVKLDYAPSLAQKNWTAKLPLGAWMSTHFLAPSAVFQLNPAD